MAKGHDAQARGAQARRAEPLRRLCARAPSSCSSLQAEGYGSPYQAKQAEDDQALMSIRFTAKAIEKACETVRQ